MADKRNTGRTRINDGMKELAGNLADPAMALAQGQGVSGAMRASLEGAMIDKLLGPTAILSGMMLGVLKTIILITKNTEMFKRGMEQVSRMQTLQTQFQTLLKSVSAAKARIAELYKFAAATPFQIGEIAEASRNLEVLTRGALSTGAGLRMVGDAAAATGGDFASTAFYIGRLYAGLKNGSPIGGVLMRLQELGLVSGTARLQLEQLTDSGADFGATWAIIQKELAKTEGAMKRQSETITGLQANLEDARAMMAGAFGEPFLEQETESIKAAIATTEHLTPVLAHVAKDLAVVTGAWSKFVNWVKQPLIPQDMLTGMWDALVAIGGAMAGMQVAVWVKKIFQARAIVDAWRKATVAANAALAANTTLQKLNASITAANAAAAKSWAAGEILGSAASKAKALALTAATIAMNIHTVAMARATAASGAFSLGTYLASTSLGVLRVAVLATGKALAFIGRALATMLVAIGPIGVALGVFAAGIIVLMRWRSATLAAIEAQEKLSKALAETTRQFLTQMKAIRTTDDWSEALAKQTAELVKAQEALSNAKNRGADKNEIRMLENEIEMRKRLLAVTQNMDTRNLAPGRKEEARLDSLTDSRRQIEEQMAMDSGNVSRLREIKADKERLLAEGELASERMREFNQSDAGKRLNAIGIEEAEARGQIAQAEKENEDPEARKERLQQLKKKYTYKHIKAKTWKEKKAVKAEFEQKKQEIENEPDSRIVVAEERLKKLAEERAAIARASGVEALQLRQRLLDLDEQIKGGRADPAVTEERERVRQRLRQIGEIAQNPGQTAQEVEQLRKQIASTQSREIDLDAETRTVELQSKGLQLAQQTHDIRVRALQMQADLAAETYGYESQAAREARNRVTQEEKAWKIARERAKAEQASQRERVRIAQMQTDAQDSLNQGEYGSARAQIDAARRAEEAQRIADARRHAEESGEDPAVAEADMRAQIAQENAARQIREEEFRREQSRQREVNEALGQGDRKGATGIRDRQKFEALTAQYVKEGGLGEEDARTESLADIQAQMMADAMGQQPRVVASSLQKVGGGGGAAGVDPLLRVQERMTALQESMVQALDIIAENTKGGNGIK
ncbi:MAG: hypothetical protein LBK99_25330 [Opitutaceae bacterium]|jgi:hypothetical protein|nr:hypothetical protein [Opitutaceae bacterium]